MIDSADAYGKGHNETWVGRAIKGQRDGAFIATKFCIVFDEPEEGTELPTGWGFSLKVNGKPAHARKALTASLRRLGVDVIGLWYAHYVDPETPVGETVGAMAEGLGVTPAQLAPAWLLHQGPASSRFREHAVPGESMRMREQPT